MALSTNLADEAQLLRRMQELIAKLITGDATEPERTELSELQEMQSRHRRTDLSEEIRARRYR